MASLDFAALGLPVSEEEACGPDLDLAGDAEYLQFMATVEGLLPRTFFEFERAKAKDDFEAAFKTTAKLLARTRDVRLLAALAKLLVLDQDIDGFVACVDLLATLLGERWEDVHPRGEDGDFGIRMVSLQTLDDLSPIVIPLQYAPLVRHKRLGPISYRLQMVAAGEVEARAGEQALDAASIDRGLMEAELDELVATRQRMTVLKAALDRIRTVCIEQVGHGEAPSLVRLSALVDKILALLDGVLVKRDPSLVLPAELPGLEPEEHLPVAATPSGFAIARPPSGRIANVAQAAEALAAVAVYFSSNEPSSPALLLVRQAEVLIGKSFLELIRILVPAHAEQAKVQIGKEQAFTLPLEQIHLLAQAGSDISTETSSDVVSTSAGNKSLAESSGAVPAVEARTRQEAVALLDEVGAFYRAIEPSSPIPLFTDRARSFVERDFMGLLKDLLPDAGFSPGAGSN